MTVTLEENTVIADRFRLVRMIGRGGMGSVWSAHHIGLDIPCALKFIEGELANVADAHARFEREAKAAAQLRSPHVVQIIDHGVWQGRPYIAMELLDGEDLGKAIAKAGGKLPAAQVNTVIQQVCRALTKAHGAGVVHRDLKPDNIFLVNDDDRQIVKILDFGVAKQTSQAIDGSNTKTGAMLGTPYYMSPEQAQGIKSVDSRSDLWSLAVIVYQCITGRLPFESEALGDLLVKIIVHPVPVPSTVATVPPGFDRWWAKAAERNPDARFATAKDFGQQLELALGASFVTDVGMHSQQHLQGTAVIQNQQTGQQQVPPFSPAQTAALVQTPHPGNQTNPTPAGMVMPQQQQHQQYQQHNSPNPNAISQSRMQAFGTGGHPPQHQLGGVNNPATFSGVEPPVTIPKKGPPVGLIAGLGGLVLVGLIVTGIVVVRGRNTTTTTGAGGGGSSSVAATGSAPGEIKTDDPVPPPPPPTDTVATAEPSTAPTNTAGAAPTGAVAPTTHKTGSTGTAAKPPNTATTPSAKVTASATAATPPPPPSASAKKWVPGF